MLGSNPVLPGLHVADRLDGDAELLSVRAGSRIFLARAIVRRDAAYAVGGFAEANLERLPRAITPRFDLDRLTRLVAADDALQRADAIGRFAVRLHDHVTGFDPGATRGRVAVIGGVGLHEHTHDILDAGHRGVFRRRLADLDAEYCTTHATVLDEVIEYFLGQ